MGYKYQMYQKEDNKWYWRFIAPNNRTMAESAYGYETDESCLKAIRNIQKESGRSKITKIVPEEKANQ